MVDDTRFTPVGLQADFSSSLQSTRRKQGDKRQKANKVWSGNWRALHSAMAGFLRRKKQDTAPPPSPIRTPSPVNAQPSPIFARFATSVQPDAQRVVSSPMALTSAPRRDQAPGISNGGAARGQREDVKQRRQAAGPSYVQTSTQDYSAASASNDYVPSYGPSSKNRLSTPPSQTQTLPPATQPTNNRPTGAGPAYVRSNPQYPSNSTAASASNAYTPSQSRNRMSTPPSRTQTLPPTAPPSNPPNRRFSQLPGTDKPLPSIIPQDNPSDPLGSRPPQSSLPANRRASTRGASGATQNPPNGRAAQQPHISSPTRSPSNATPGVGTRTFVSPSQTPSAAPNSALGSSQDPSRYQKEHARQDLRHKLSDASTASGLQPVIAAPASPPRHNGQWAPDGRAAIAAPAPTPSSYEVNIFFCCLT
ncbi:hypothetical protein C8R47DRAFT_178604 [Mycena vitilis]|nr:hypothetical protein C8R47DRAFT_178604 [Mycena vitilis]